MQVDIFHRMFEFYTTSYTHFENRAEDILIYLEEMGDCVKKEIIQEEYIISESAFADLENLSEKDADFLQKFTFICLLNFDVYTKKLLIEKIIDSMKKPEPPKNTKRKRS